MRGGTSKGLFFLENHLPQDQEARDRVILAAYGSPDLNRRQIDGVGGGVSTTSKTAIICRSTHPDYDVVYHFGQVSIDRPVVDYRGNCGNISSAVGPFAVDAGLVEVKEPMTTVRIYQKNTGQLIVAEVPVKDGRYNSEGDYAIAGVPGTGGRVNLDFINPGGSFTGRLFPTGNLVDTMEIPPFGDVRVTLIDAGNPAVLILAEDIGLLGTEIGEVENTPSTYNTLELIRCRASVLMGLAATPEEAGRKSQAVPKVGFVGPPRKYTALTGQVVTQDQLDLVARVMSMGTLHRSFPVTAFIYTAGAAKIPGTVVSEVVRGNAYEKGTVRIGHPGGVIEAGAQVEEQRGSYHILKATMGRTARRLMEGYVFVPERYFSG
ncbi:MAG: 3-methylitaconate isomerase [Deltaproteobacteria bacterium]|nr:3-methylitaconate isomerase [Deltaproteobacteria bacterium]